MIVSFKHKGLKSFYQTGSTAGILVLHRKKLRMQLAALDTAVKIQDLDLPGYHLHQLSGNRQNTWSIRVSGNWRLTFMFEQGEVHVLNYEDYH